MFSNLFVIFFCLTISNIYAEKCPGASTVDAQEDFKAKLDLAPIVAYGSIAQVTNNVAKFQLLCVLKGQLSLSSVDLSFLAEVTNTSECHYLTEKKNYIVFLDVLKTNPSNNKPVYALANLEEIEINEETVNRFLAEECDDEDEYGIDMTMFFYDGKPKCGQFSQVCNEMSKASLRTNNLPPLTSQTKFLGGFKKVLSVPKVTDGDDSSINSKSNGGVGDEKGRNAASLINISMTLVTFICALVMFLKN